MNQFCEDVHKLEDEFKQCRKLLNAIGDENRQHLLCVMMNMPIDGSRVIEIAEQTHLSRPAVSHHMQILKDAGIVKSRKEGTQVYYYFDPEDNDVEKFSQLAGDIIKIINMLPERNEEGVAVQ